MEFTIYKIGKTAKEYTNLQTKFITFLQPNRVNVVSLPSSKKQDQKGKIKQETEVLLSRVDPDLPVIILTEKGNTLNSIEFSDLVSSLTMQTGKMQILIGGAYGFDSTLLPKNLKQISLSELTFPHDLALIVLLEQLYRSMTITKGKSYHY